MLQISSSILAVLLLALVPTTVLSQCSPESELISGDTLAGDFYGHSVSVFGDIAVVGAVYNDTIASDCGAAYVYRLGQFGWTLEQKLTASDAVNGERFGISVSASSDTIVIGAHYADSNSAPASIDSGAAYVFRFNGTSWIEEQKLLASDEGAGNWFGVSVSLLNNTIIVGSSGSNAEAAYVFQYDGANWIEEQKLVASDGSSGDRFGQSVSIGTLGVVVGAPQRSEIGQFSGTAYVYTYNGGNWTEQQKLIPSDLAGNDRFAYSCSIDEDLIVAGSYRKQSNTGAAYVFRFNGLSWAEEQKIEANNANVGDEFGTSVAVNNSRIIVGSPFSSQAGFERGAAYVFEFDELNWFETQVVVASNGATDGHFGIRVAVNGDSALIGAPYHNSSSGSAYLYTIPNELGPVIQSLTPSLTSCQNSLVELEVVASTTGATSYQWYLDGIQIIGAESATLSITSAQPSSSGDYVVEISDSCGTVLSMAISLSIEECFVRGDCNQDQSIDIADVVTFLSYLFSAGLLPCQKSGDSNDDGSLDVADAVFELSFIFSGGMPLASPTGSCGVDPTPDTLSCENPCP